MKYSLKTVWALLGILLLIFGIPGMIEDYRVWVTWFAGWEWWNFLFVLGGSAVTVTAIYSLARDVNKALVSSDSDPVSAPTPDVSTSSFADDIRRFWDWYGKLDERDGAQLALRMMIMPFLFVAMMAIMFGPILLVMALIDYLVSFFR